MTDRPGRPALAGALVATAILCLACAAPKPRGPVLLHPVPPSDGRYALERGALVYAGPGFTVAVRPWDHRLVAAEFLAAGEPNPFGDDAAAGRFLFLRVRLENGAAQKIIFNPMSAWLLSEGNAPLLPLENSDLFVFADDRAAEAEARGRAFRRVAFDTTATVHPGAALERYLVFRAPDEAAATYHLVIEDLWLGAASHDLTFSFEAFPAAEAAGR